MRVLILRANPEITGEWKGETPGRSREGIVCTGEAYGKVVKLPFARGASVPDPVPHSNPRLEGRVRRAICIHEGAEVDTDAFTTLERAEVARNGAAVQER